MTGGDEAPSKLTVTKQRWAQEGRFLTGRPTRPEAERLPPGQHLVTDWPVLDLGLHPAISRERWRLQVFGAVERPAEWDWPAFQELPQTRTVSDIHCVTTWSRLDNQWDGVLTRDLLAAVAARNGRITAPGSDGGSAHGYHLDARGYEAVLRRVAVALGVAIVPAPDPRARIENGVVASVTTGDGRAIEADLFVDATGS